MLPLEKAMASPRSSPAPPEPPMLGSDDAAQQGEPEAEAEASAEADAGLEAKASAETRGEAEGRAKTIPEGREGVAEGRADAAKVEADAEANTSVGEVGADMAEVSANAAKVEIDAEVKADDVDADVAEVHGSAAEADDAAEVDAEVDPDAAEVEAEAEAETGCERTPVDLEFSRLRFREFAYQEAAGPHQTLARLHELCRQWLRPESCSKEEILEMLVLEQFLGILPDRVRPWVVAQYPENCKKAASLVEGLSDVLDEPGEAAIPEEPAQEEAGRRAQKDWNPQRWVS